MNELASQAIAPAMIASSTIPTGPSRCASDGFSAAAAVSSAGAAFCASGSGNRRVSSFSRNGGYVGLSDLAAGAGALLLLERGRGAVPLLERGSGAGAVPLLERGSGAGAVPLFERGNGAGRIAGRCVGGSAAAGFAIGGRGGIWALGRRTTGADAANGRRASITSWQLA
jgi:hypothetical protein